MNKEKQKFNVALVGNTCVGKTSLLQKLIDNKFDLKKNKTLSTVGIEQFTYKTTRDGEKIKINFIDTAGQERYRALNWNLIKSACAFLIVFDLTDEISFDDVLYWKDQIKEHVDLQKIDLIMVANKCDLKEERKVSSKRIENFEKKNQFGTNYLFFETSALTGEGINECIEGLINKIMDRYEKLKDKNSINQNIKIKHEIDKYDKNDNNNDDNNKNNNNDKKKKKKRKCCN